MLLTSFNILLRWKSKTTAMCLWRMTEQSFRTWGSSSPSECLMDLLRCGFGPFAFYGGRSRLYTVLSFTDTFFGFYHTSCPLRLKTSDPSQTLWKNIVCLHRNPISCDQFEKKTYIHLFGRVFYFWIPHCWLKQCSHSSEQTNPFVVEGWKNCPSQFQGSPEKNLLILCDKICATQVTGFKYLNLEEDPHPPHIWAKRTSRASCVRLQQSAPPPAGQLTPHPCTWKV